ncbi:hypothetical protein CMUS01_09457 [Colletotrichum musicola]|uniref:Uncharacterized protein n=1 Tax=Colletotrichum musicola TaxID=2175873 RepID=A0A8H6K7B6_9PEZI|nr:hypothetical protein CMUS01_09457 [Colletotrichum musicola]
MLQRWRNGQVYDSLAPTPAAAYGGFRGSSEGSQHNATRITSGAATGGAAGAVRAVLTDTAIEEYPKSISRTLGATPTHQVRRLVSALYSSQERLLSPQPANEGAE